MAKKKQKNNNYNYNHLYHKYVLHLPVERGGGRETYRGGQTRHK